MSPIPQIGKTSPSGAATPTLKSVQSRRCCVYAGSALPRTGLLEKGGLDKLYKSLHTLPVQAVLDPAPPFLYFHKLFLLQIRHMVGHIRLGVAQQFHQFLVTQRLAPQRLEQLHPAHICHGFCLVGQELTIVAVLCRLTNR